MGADTPEGLKYVAIPGAWGAITEYEPEEVVALLGEDAVGHEEDVHWLSAALVVRHRAQHHSTSIVFGPSERTGLTKYIFVPLSIRLAKVNEGTFDMPEWLSVDKGLASAADPAAGGDETVVPADGTEH